jgi:sugar phosphate permease
MATFGALPYFLTIYFQDGKGWTALDTGLAFIVPAVAIASGTQIGEPLTARLGSRAALLVGWATGLLGTGVLAAQFTTETGYGWLVPALIVSGIGQGITWTAMFITASTGVPAEHDGVAAGLATTTLNVGNAIGLAVLIAIAAGTSGRRALIAVSIGLVVGLALSTLVPRRPTDTEAPA